MMFLSKEGLFYDEIKLTMLLGIWPLKMRFFMATMTLIEVREVPRKVDQRVDLRVS